MESTEFLNNFVSTTSSILTETGVPILVIVFAFAFVVFCIGFIYNGFLKGLKKVFR